KSEETNSRALQPFHQSAPDRHPSGIDRTGERTSHNVRHVDRRLFEPFPHLEFGRRAKNRIGDSEREPAALLADHRLGSIAGSHLAARTVCLMISTSSSSFFCRS